MCRHPCHVFGNLAGRTAKTRTLKKDDFTSYSKRIGDGRVPIVQGPGEVLKTQQWWTITFPKATIGILFEFALDELRRSSSVACVSHGVPSFRCSSCCGFRSPCQRGALGSAPPLQHSAMAPQIRDLAIGSLSHTPLALILFRTVLSQ